MMISLLKLRQDYRRVEAGDWVDDIPGMAGLRLKVRGISCRAFDRGISALRTSHQVSATRQYMAWSALPMDDRERLLCELVADALLLGWEGLAADDGTVLPYTVETARKLLGNPELRALVDAVRFAAATIGPTDPPADNSDLSEEERAALESLDKVA